LAADREPAPPLEPELHAELETLYSTGEQRFAAGDLDGAIASFSDGLSRTEADGPPRLRAYFAVSLAIAHLDRFDATGDLADAQRGHGLLVATVERDAKVLQAEPRLEALARRNLDRARAQLPPEPEAPEPEPPEPEPGPPPAANAPRSTPADATPPDEVGRRRGAGIGLLVSGTALVAGGVAVIFDGATLERRARAIAEDPPQGRQKEYLEQEVPRLANIRYGIGIPLLVTGVGLVVGGAILLRRAARTRDFVVQPALGPAQAGVVVRGHF
jgi:hypothetical protein